MRRYEAMIHANKAREATATSSVDLEPLDTFRKGLTAAEAARLQAAGVHEAHTTQVLRLLRERERRQQLQRELREAVAERAAAQVRPCLTSTELDRKHATVGP